MYVPFFAMNFSGLHRHKRTVGREEIEEMEEMEEDSTEIGRQRNKERRMEEANCAPGRPPGRPVEEAGRPCKEGAVDRPRSTD